ncbi:hypothetical protein [Luteimonas sp. TWI1416]|uniref:hypothetical protein n=1 Tax=unclassified Luteimonas TaxID=2629088 RepID=UPI003208DA93
MTHHGAAPAVLLACIAAAWPLSAAYALAIGGSSRNDARLTCLIDPTRLRIGQLQQLRAL